MTQFYLFFVKKSAIYKVRYIMKGKRGMISCYGELRTIKHKKVFITESHHFVLLAWAEYRKAKEKPPILLTLDHHTDTHSAFLHHTYDSAKGKCDDDYARELVSLIDYNADKSVLDAVSRLSNDEHIDTAIKSGIISKAFVVCYNNYHDKTYRQSDICVIGNTCSIGCAKMPHDDECVIPHFNQAIETVFLDHKLSIINEMLPETVIDGLIGHDYILDIDLDYFHTLRSIQPNDTSTFYELINNAGLITVAKETCWIDEWRETYEYDKNLDGKFLLNHLLEHIDKAQP